MSTLLRHDHPPRARRWSLLAAVCTAVFVVAGLATSSQASGYETVSGWVDGQWTTRPADLH